MAVKTENGVTTLTPTAWKWYLGAACSFAVWLGVSDKSEPMFSVILLSVVAFFVVMGSGHLQKLILYPDRLELKSAFRSKSYRWDEMRDFRVNKIKSGLFTASTMIAFTHANQEGSLLAGAAKLLSGGTHSIPVIGMSAKQLATLMMAYQQGYVPADTVVETDDLSSPLPARQEQQPRAGRVASPPKAAPRAATATHTRFAAFGRKPAMAPPNIHRQAQPTCRARHTACSERTVRGLRTSAKLTVRALGTPGSLRQQSPLRPWRDSATGPHGRTHS